MKSETKLAQFVSTLNRLHLPEVVSTARRALESRLDRSARPLRDLDGWSTQAEVAFYEEHGHRA